MSFKSFLYFLSEEVERRNTTYPVVVGLYGGMLLNTVLFTSAWIALVTTMDPITFMQSDLLWYTKVLASFGYVFVGGLTAFMYGEMTSASVAWLFGFYTMKTVKLGPKVVLSFILGLLLLGLFPYIAMIGFLGLRVGFSEVGELEPLSLLVGGLFVTILGVIIPGLLSDPQTLRQKKVIVLNRLLEAGVETAEDEIKNNPQLALKVVGVNELNGGMITDTDRILSMMTGYPDWQKQARTLMQFGDVGVWDDFPDKSNEFHFVHNRKKKRSQEPVDIPAESVAEEDEVHPTG